MNEVFYNDSREKVVLPKIAVVIPAFITNKNYGYYQENKAETLALNLKAHKHFKAGADYTIIIVNHGSPLEDEHILRDQLEGTFCIDRPNEGFSFGAWKQAWENYKETFDFYLFTEDDMAPAKDGWLSDLLLAFLSQESIGAVGNWLEMRSATEGSFSTDLWKEIDYKRDMMYNFDGSYTFTSSKILKQIDARGGMMVLPCEPLHPRAATVNECIFQQPIMELGYKIVTWSDRFIVHGSELFTGKIDGDPNLPPGPLMNINGRRKIPKIAEIFKPICNPEE